MPWSKVPHERPQYSVAPEVLYVEDRKTYPKDNGNTVVAFIKTDTRDLCDECLDPRVVTITSLLQSNCKIEPGDFTNYLGITDKSDLDRIQYTQNSILADYLEKNLDHVKSVLLPSSESKSVESKSDKS